MFFRYLTPGIVIALILCIPLYCQQVVVSDYVQVRTSEESTTLDRLARELTTEIRITLENTSTDTVYFPLHAVVLAPPTVQVLGALGGHGASPYGTFYFSLGSSGRAFSPGEETSFTAQLVRDASDRLEYMVVPYGISGSAQTSESPPLLFVNPQTVVIHENETAIISVSGLDPDGRTVALSAQPLIQNADFSAQPGQPAYGSFEFHPSFDQAGTYTVLFRAVDSTGLSTFVSATITVFNTNRPPIVSAPATVLTQEGDQIAIQTQAADPDQDSIQYSVGPLPENSYFLPSSESITFAPNYDQSGTYLVDVQVDDGELTSDLHTIRIEVADTPVGGNSQKHELILEVDPVSPVTLATQQKITGRVNETGQSPPYFPPSIPLITGMNPAGAKQGDTLQVLLTGGSGQYLTHFESGSSQPDFGPDITVNSVAVNGPTSLVADITIDPSAELGGIPVEVVTGTETAISTALFNIQGGITRITGRLIDPGTNQPLSNVRVTIQGTAISTTTGSDGSFILENVPIGSQTLILNPPDHELIQTTVDSQVGVTVELGEIESRSTVFDPSAPPGPNLLSVLGRGVSDITGLLDPAQVRQLIIDTILLAGGDEVGVLDEYENQLNPAMVNVDPLSITSSGVDVHADRILQGESITLMEVITDLTFGFNWSGNEPRFIDWLHFLQQRVNQAWADPNAPESIIPILLFNRGKNLMPNPPTLTADTRLNKFQAFLAVSGFMLEVYKQKNQSWALGNSESQPENRSASPSNSAASRNGTPPKPYSVTWKDLLDTFPEVEEPNYSTVSGDDPNLPDIESLLGKYYLDSSNESLETLKNRLLETFPSLNLEEKIFNNNPYGVDQSLQELIEISDNDVQIQTQLENAINMVTGKDNRQEFFFAPYRTQKGNMNQTYFNFRYTPTESLMPRIIHKSWVPGAPFLHQVIDASWNLVDPADPYGAFVRLPAAKIIFSASGDDLLDKNPENVTFYYRLWRLSEGETELRTGKTINKHMVLAAFAEIGGSGTYHRLWKVEGTERSFYFLDPLPNPGFNRYQVDCIRIKGDPKLIDKLTLAEIQKLEFYLSGYLDQPVYLDPFSKLGRTQIHPGQYYFNDLEHDVSPLSRSGSVFMAGRGAGLSGFGRVDIAADQGNANKTYVSIPGFRFTTDPLDRGSGILFRYKPLEQELEEWARPGFMSPGQVGLAIDSNSNLYMENGASEDYYGGRVFRYLGYLEPDEEYAPEYPNPNWEDEAKAKTGSPPGRLFVGSVNYFSRLIQRAHPTQLQQIIMGPESDLELGEELYLAELLNNRIKKLTVQAPETKNYPANRNVARDWAWTDTSGTTIPSEDQINFTPQTDLTWNPTRDRLYITQGSNIISTGEGKNNSASITEGSGFFVATAGCDICSSRGTDYLFVADHGDGTDDFDTGGRIYRIPLSDLPLTVPTNPEELKDLQETYLFLRGLNRPGAIRITDNNQSMVFTDETGFRYVNFGFTGKILDINDLPLIGAVVTVSTLEGTQTAVTDSKGEYAFSFNTPIPPTLLMNVQHPTSVFSESVSTDGTCNALQDVVPCVVITDPGDEQQIDSGTITVRGSIYPASFDFTVSGGILQVSNSSGITNYSLQFTGNDNDWEINGVSLETGDNALRAFSFAAGIFGSGSSHVTNVKRNSSPPNKQSVAGTVTDSNGNPRSGVVVQIFIQGVEEAKTETDACGFYSVDGLPLGIVHIELEE